LARVVSEAGGLDERTMPIRGREEAPAGGDRPLDDPRALTILTTEHWSLLSARSLVYNEAFARAGMFLTFLSATLVALGLVSAGTGFSRQFLVVAAIVLALDLFVGLATVGRVASAGSEDMRYLQGMNRLRHAYHEMVPGLKRYFITGQHDDIPGVFSVYGAASVSSRTGIVHGFTTTPGMVFVICAAVAGALVAVITLLLTDSTILAGLAGLVALVAGATSSIAVMHQWVGRFGASMESVFPTPGPPSVTDPVEVEKASPVASGSAPD
jgi:hypothetical protein